MQPNDAIPLIDVEWAPAGFFGMLREGTFDPIAFARCELLLRSIEVSDEAPLPRRFVAVTWYMPLFMSWQIERVQEKGGDVPALKRAIDRVEGILEDVLGIP